MTAQSLGNKSRNLRSISIERIDRPTPTDVQALHEGKAYEKIYFQKRGDIPIKVYVRRQSTSRASEPARRKETVLSQGSRCNRCIIDARQRIANKQGANPRDDGKKRWRFRWYINQGRCRNS